VDLTQRSEGTEEKGKRTECLKKRISSWVTTGKRGVDEEEGGKERLGPEKNPGDLIGSSNFSLS